MRHWILFIVPALIWGSTWLVIKEQLGSVAPEASVAYRFALGALVLFGCCLWQRAHIRYSRQAHVAFAFVGICHYAVDYVLLYHAEQTLSSGAVAVVFSSAVLWNLLASRRRVSVALAGGAVLGMLTLTVTFWSELEHLHMSAGVVLVLLAAMASAAGNLCAQRLYATGVAVLPSTAWSMLYGAIAVVVYCATTGVAFRFDASPRYVASLVYLAVFGSAIAFLAYLKLIERIGAGRASYISFVTPMLAVTLSCIFKR